MRVQIEKKMERKILGPELRERRRERVGEEAIREISHTVLKGQVEGNRLSVKAGAVRAGGLRERGRRREKEQRMTCLLYTSPSPRD